MADLITLEQLHERTAAFFDLHWPQGEPQPEWSSSWTFTDTIPNHDQQGCYALLNGSRVLYIGVGAGRGPAAYLGAGLGSRLHRYWRRHRTTPLLPDGKANYEPAADWSDASAIVTIPFPADRSYLAYALEPFLIRSLKPARNVVHA